MGEATVAMLCPVFRGLWNLKAVTEIPEYFGTALILQMNNECPQGSNYLNLVDW